MLKEAGFQQVLEAKRAANPKIGVFGIGLAAYWLQFEGLHERLQGYLSHIEGELSHWGDVVAGGMVDSVEKARAVGAQFALEDVDVIFVHAATYATSSQVLPVIQNAKA